MRTAISRIALVGILASSAGVSAIDAAASGAVRLGIKAIGYFAAGAVGAGVGQSAGTDIYQAGKNVLLGEQQKQHKQLKPPQHTVYELSHRYWRGVTTARYCIELVHGQCAPCDLADKICNLRTEKPIVFSEHQVR